MTPRTFFCTFVGGIAREVLDSLQPGKVMGITSKGIFLHCADSILFITDTPYKGPFNLFIPGFERLMKTLTITSGFELIPGALYFPDPEVKIIFENAEVWIPAPPPAIRTTQDSQLAQVRRLLDQISTLDPGKGWLFLHNHQPALPESLMLRISANTRGFSGAYRQQDLKTCLQAAGNLLGLGGGLTPSGDDWLSGFVLYQSRLIQASGGSAPFLSELITALVQLAIQKTTTISVNRISAAGRGWAEEPFLQMIDCLFAGEEMAEGLPELLIHFGHSSGVDTTLGIAAACDK